MTFAGVTFSPGEYVYADGTGIIVSAEPSGCRAGDTAGIRFSVAQSPVIRVCQNALPDITEFALRKSIVRALKIFHGLGRIGRFSEYMRFLANYVVG